jgi:hypothetical protein
MNYTVDTLATDYAARCVAGALNEVRALTTGEPQADTLVVRPQDLGATPAETEALSRLPNRAARRQARRAFARSR